MVPSAPPAPPGFTTTLTSFTNTTPVTISTSGTSSATSTITVSGAGTYVHDVDLTTFLKHSFPGDIDLTLTSPAGTVVTITTDNAVSSDDVFNGTLWDDDADPGNPGPFAADTFAASNVVRDAVYAVSVLKPTLTPEEPLGAFIGEDPNGTWTLTVSDDANLDGGSLDQWKLDLTTVNGTPTVLAPAAFTSSPGAAIGPAVGVTTSTVTVSGANPYLAKLTLQTFITHTNNSNLDVTLTSPAGTSVTITTDNGSTNDDVFNGTLWDDDADPGNPAPFATDTFAASNLVGDTTYVNATVKSTLAPEEPLAAFIGENPNGTWTLTVSDDAASDGGTLANWTLNISGTQPGPIPAALGGAPGVTTAGATSHPVTIILLDDTGIDVDTVINNQSAIRVTGPNGFNVPAAYVGIDNPTDGTPRTATFAFTPPGGSWDATDRGTYALLVQGNQIADTGGTFVPAGTIGSFVVFIPVFTVSSTADAGFGSLRQVIDDANVVPGANTVTFDPAVFSTPRTISLLSPLPLITDPLTLSGPGAGLLTVRRDPGASASFRIFDSTAPALTLTGMTVTGGSPGSAGDGGGLQALGTTPNITLDGVVFSGNSAAGEGGAIFMTTGGFLTLRNSTLSGNSAATDGGGVYFFSGGSLLMENSTITGNSAGGTAVGGGAMYFFGTASATPPAGFTASTLVVRNSTIANNTSAAGGGGLVLPSFTGTLLVQNRTITGNTAATSGGGIAVTSGSGSVTVQNSTVAGNTANGTAANTGGGGLARVSGTAGTVTVVNSVVSGNTNANAADILSSSVTTTNVNFSAVGSTTGYTPSGTSGNNLAPGTNLLLGALSGNGGPTLTLAPGVGSPLINAGSNVDVPAGLTTDQRGAGFDRIFGAAVDIGAVEVQPPRVTINQAAGQLDPTITPSATFVVHFTTPVTGFTPAGVNLAGSTAPGTLVAQVIGSGTDYTVTVTGMTGLGTVVASVRPGAATDAFGSGNLASTSTDNVVTYDPQAPTVSVSRAVGQVSPTNAEPIAFTVTFSEPVTGFTESDVSFLGSTVGGSLVAAVTGTGPVYTVSVTGMTGVGTVVVSIPPGGVLDLAGNPNSASTGVNNFVTFDAVAPTVTINQAAGQPDPGAGTIKFDVLFDEPVTGFTAADVDLSGSTIGGTLVAQVTGSGASYTVTVTGMAGLGVVTATVPAAAAADLAGNPSEAATSTDNSVTFDPVAPTVTINRAAGQADPGGPGPVVFDVVFSEPVTGFTGADVVFTGSTVGGTPVAAVTGSGTTYTVSVIGLFGNGTLVASIPAGVAFDAALNVNEASTSTDNAVDYQDFPGQLEFASATFTASEVGGTVTVTVNRTGGGGGAVTVNYVTGGGTATAGADYQAATGTLIWANGQAGPKTFVIALLDDTLFEGPETIGLTLLNPTGGATIGAQATALIQLADHEEGRLEFESSVVTVDEGAGFATITVVRTGGTDGPVSVQFSTADGTARSTGLKLDYTAVTDTKGWSDGEGGAKTFTVPILEDIYNEGRETIVLNLTNPTGGAIAGAAGALVIRPSDPRFNPLFLDSEGDIANVKLSGPGQLGFYLTDPDGDHRGDLELIEVSGTDPLRSVVTLIVQKGVQPTADGKITLGGIIGSGLKAIVAAKANLDPDILDPAEPAG
ncbi:MAG TPA: Calx-beta domain-containing protein, partial [Gemmataceae bacterium]|nr:Calx-beta domain-containing protein [Gemmataceae bacterium]